MRALTRISQGRLITFCRSVIKDKVGGNIPVQEMRVRRTRYRAEE